MNDVVVEEVEIIGCARRVGTRDCYGLIGAISHSRYIRYRPKHRELLSSRWDRAGAYLGC